MNLNWRRKEVLGFGLAVLMVAITVGCSKPANSPAPANTPKGTPTPTGTGAPTPGGTSEPDPTPRPSPRTPLEETLHDIAVFDFVQVFVFTRLDGKSLDAGDYQFLKANAPKETNQWAKSTDNLHAVVGTNFVFSSTQLDTIRTRFKVEDVTGDYGRKK